MFCRFRSSLRQSKSSIFEQSNWTVQKVARKRKRLLFGGVILCIGQAEWALDVLEDGLWIFCSIDKYNWEHPA